MSAVEALRSVPDQQELVNSWLNSLLIEKMSAQEYTRLQIRLLQLMEQRLRSGKIDPGPLNQAVKAWVKLNPVEKSILGFLRAGTSAMASQFPKVSRDEIQAFIVLEGISQCLNPT